MRVFSCYISQPFRPPASWSSRNATTASPSSGSWKTLPPRSSTTFLLLRPMWPGERSVLLFCMLLHIVAYCCMLLHVVVCCCILLYVVACCCMLLYVVVCCCMLLYVVACCCILLHIVACRCIFLHTSCRFPIAHSSLLSTCHPLCHHTTDYRR